MKKELQLIAHLYDEADPESESLRELLQDPELASEYQALSEARFALDHRSRVRPSPALLNAIVRQATPKPASLAGRPDRAPLRRIVFRRRSLVAGLALAASFALLVIVQPWSPTPGADGISTVADNPFDFTVPAESLLRALPPAAVPLAARQANPAGVPDWDSGDDLRRLSRRIQSLQAAGVSDWDEPAIPLEMLTPGGTNGLQQAGSRRQ